MTVRTGQPRTRSRWIALGAVVALLSAMLTTAVLAVHDVGEFELDKNASNNTNITKLGDLAANISSTATTLNICRTAAATPAPDFTIQIRAERMTVTNVANSNFGGNCGGTKQTFTVTRGVGTVAAAQAKGGVDGIISLVVTATKDGPDWNQVHQSVTADGNNTGDDDKCIGVGDLVECAFVSDQIGPSTFIGGASKDHLPIEGWSHTSGASPDKAEILNAYAAKAIDENGDQLLYFGMDRYAVDGSTDIGFWFFQDEVVANEDGSFTGTHTGDMTLGNDDILALATFTQGGAATNIRVFRWVGTGGNESGTINGPDADAGDCIQNPPLTDDSLCGTVNDATIPVPWTYTFKGAPSGGWIPAGGFFEGGINLTELGLDGCFSSFLAETRSSPEITAILKDFALGSFEACETSLVTTPANGSGTALTDTDDPTNGLPDIQIGTGSTGVAVKDNAAVTVNGLATWTGTVSFFICGPIATGTCDTGGVAAGTKDVSNTTTTASSNAATLTSVGRYCWRGVFTPSTQSAADGLEVATDASTGECFEVKPVTPTLDTVAVDSAGDPLTDDVPFGSPVYDQATLAGTANKPGTNGGTTPGVAGSQYPSINATNGAAAGGTITFTLIGPGDCETVASGDGDNPETGVAVSGDDDYMSSGFTPDAPGDYHWQASYSGDSPNTLGATHNDDCDDTDEDVTVEQLQPTMDTTQDFVPNDSATITVGAGAGDLGGVVVFQLFVDDPTCAGTAAYTSGDIAVSDTDDVGDTSLSDTVSSSNTTAYDVSGTTFHWVVTFTSSNAAHLDVTSGCGNEHSSITIDNGETQPATP